MKRLLLPLTYLTLTLSCIASPEAMISKSDLVESFKKHREASTIIAKIMSEMLERPYDSNNPYSRLKPNEDQINRYMTAQKLLIKSLALNPFDPKVLVDLGNSYVQIQNDQEKALELFTKARLLDPDFEEAAVSRAIIALPLKRFDLATEDIATLKKVGSPNYKALSQTLNTLKPN